MSRSRRSGSSSRPSTCRRRTSATAIAVAAGDEHRRGRRARARTLLVGERTALNFLQRLSGIATPHAPVRRRGRRPHHDPRHAKDDADAARAGEVRGARRRRDQPPRRPLRRRADQGQPHPPGRRRERRGRRARAPTARAADRGRSADARRRSTRRSRPAPTSILVDNMSTADIREAVARADGRAQDRDLRRRHAGSHPGARRDRRRLRLGRRADAFRAGRRHQL